MFVLDCKVFPTYSWVIFVNIIHAYTIYLMRAKENEVTSFTIVPASGSFCRVTLDKFAHQCGEVKIVGVFCKLGQWNAIAHIFQNI